MADVIAYLTVSNVIKQVRSYFASGVKPRTAEYVGDVTGISIYPIKSMGGIQLNSCECTQRGIKCSGMDVFDRNFMIVNDQRKFVHGNLVPKLPTIKCDITEDSILLQHESMLDFNLPLSSHDNHVLLHTKVWEEHIQGYDCGDDIAHWINSCLGSSNMRLIHCSHDLPHRELNKQADKWKIPSKNGDTVTYQDEFPVMLASQASLDDLNQKIESNVEITMNRFRPNIVISGCKAFDEDKWDEIWIGNCKFRNMKPCIRCQVTTIDPKTGKKDKQQEPLTTLRKYRLDSSKFGNSPMFGIYLVVDSPGSSVINIRDPVYVTRK